IWTVAANAVYQPNMLLDVRVQTFRAQVDAIAAPLGADYRVPHFPVAALGILSARAPEVNAVRVNEIGRQMVVDIPVEFLPRAPRHAAGRYHADRMSPHHPVAEIDGVNVLLHHLISTNPHEGVPVPMLPL